MNVVNRPRVYSSDHRGKQRSRSNTERSISSVMDRSWRSNMMRPNTERSISSRIDKSLRSKMISKRDIVNSTSSPQRNSPSDSSKHSQPQFKKKLSSPRFSQDNSSSAPSLTARKVQQKPKQPAAGISSQRPHTKSAQRRFIPTRSRPSSTSTASKVSSSFDSSTGHAPFGFSRRSLSKSDERKNWFELPNPILPKLPRKGSCLSTIIETSHHNLYSPSNSTNPQVAALLTSMSTIWRKKQLYDVVLAIGPHRLGAHKLILAASSEYFYELFTREEENQDEEQFMYTLKGINYETMRMLLESMYTCHLVVTSENVERILNAATFLSIPAALDSCSDFLIRNLNVNSCLVTIALAQVFELDNVAEKACKLAANNFLEITEMEEFLELTESMLIMLLQRDDLKVESELQVFEALLRWIDVDREERLAHAEKLLENIRLPLIRPPDLVDQVESVDFLMGIPSCEALVKEALHYHCLPQRQAVLQTCRTTPRSSVKTTTLVALGGHPRHAKDPVSNRMEYYNPEEKKWKTLTQMKQPRHHHAVACLGGFVYVAGGRTTSLTNVYPLRSVYRYDPRTDAWLRVADMINARESFQLTVLDGKIYAVGGRVDDQTSLADVERYKSSTDEWEEVAPLSDARRGVAIATHDGKLYAVGGSGNRKISCKVERYNPHTDAWEVRRQLTTPRFFAILSSVEEHLFLTGGATLDSETGQVHCVPNVERYNSRTDTWTVMKSMSEPRAEAASCVLGRRIFVLGGYSWDTKSFLQSVECYDTEEDEWSEFEEFPRAYTGMACCALTLHKLP